MTASSSSTLVEASPDKASPRRDARRVVVFYRSDPNAPSNGHDLRTKSAVVEKLAGLMGCDYAGEFDGSRPRPGMPMYFVPSETLPDLASAQRLGIRSADDLFGGVVPFPFVATKVISHPLLQPDSAAPNGWSSAFADQIAGAVLPGFSVFSAADARLAAARMFAQGAVRLKDPTGVGGSGQWVLHNGAELEGRLKSIDAQRLARSGLVLERNLSGVTTHSVGQVHAGALRAAYCGVQNNTRNHRGEEVYGGSDLLVARGGFDELLKLDLTAAQRTAVEQALSYHRAALSSFAGLFASRCNYDVAQGSDDSGQRCSGVLEQSWRIGGASGAEVAALQAFAEDPQLQTVRASTCERYGDGALVPKGAWLLFDGFDPRVGRITKYATAGAHGHD